MAVTFDPKTGLKPEDAATVREAIRADWKAAFSGGGLPELDTGAETPAGQLIDSETALVYQKDSDLVRIAGQFNPDTAEGRWQDALGKIYFLERKLTASTVAVCECRGLYNTVIPEGSVVEADGGRRLYALNEAAIGGDGVVQIEFALDETGPIPIPAHAIKKIVTVIPGWDTVDNPEAGVPGHDEELPRNFERRRYASVARMAACSAEAIYAAVADVDGVLDAAVFNNDTAEEKTFWGVTVAAHSVGVCVYGGEGADIAKALYEKKPVGCGTSGNTDVTHTDKASKGTVNTYKIVRPTVKPFKIKVKVKLSDRLAATVENDVRDAMLANFNGETDWPRVGLGQTVYAARFVQTALDACGVNEILGVEVALDEGEFGGSVTINGDVEPELSRENVTVDKQE